MCFDFAGDLLAATPLLPWHGVQVCCCQVGHMQRRLSQHPAVNQSKAGQQGSHLQLSESWHGESTMTLIIIKFPFFLNKKTTFSNIFFCFGTSQVLSGCVASVEDHGYIIDIGINGTNAFLPKKATKDQHNNQEGKRG